jgi:hypothetical protein
MSDGANIDYYIGEVITLRLSCLDDEGQPSDLSDYTTEGWVRQSPRDTINVIDLSPTIPDASSGIVEVNASTDGAAAGNYTWRVLLVDSENNPIVIGGGNLKLRS